MQTAALPECLAIAAMPLLLCQGRVFQPCLNETRRNSKQKGGSGFLRPQACDSSGVALLILRIDLSSFLAAQRNMPHFCTIFGHKTAAGASIRGEGVQEFISSQSSTRCAVLFEIMICQTSPNHKRTWAWTPRLS